MSVLKLNSDGGYRWHTFYGSTEIDEGFGIVSTANGVAVAGYSNDGWQAEPGRSALNPYNSPQHSHSITVLALDFAGTYQWHTYYGYDSIGWSIAADTGHNLFVGATGGGTWKGDQGQNPLHNWTGNNMVVIKLDAPTTIPEIPTLVSPKLGAIVGTPTVNLNWTDVPARTYYNLELRQGKNTGKLILLTGTTDSNLTTPTLVNKKAYYWRAQTCNELGCSEWSVWRNFTIQLR